MKIRPKFEYEAIQYNGNNIEEIKELFKSHNLEVLKIVDEPAEGNFPDFIDIYYIDIYKEPKLIELMPTYWIWIDEMGEVNFCIPDYLFDNYEVQR